MERELRPATKLPAVVMLASFVIVVAGMKAASSILVPFLLAVFIAIICTPPLFWLQRKGVSKLLALTLILVTILGFGFLLGVLVGPSLKEFLSALPAYQATLSDRTVTIADWMRAHGMNIRQNELPYILHPGWIMNLTGGLFEAVSTILTQGFLILLTVVFILLEAAGFSTKLRAAMKFPEKSLAAIDKFSQSAKRYLVIKTAVSASMGIVIWLWLLILGVDYPVLWGMLTFLLNYVPNIGGVIAAIPAVLLALVQLGTGSALLAALGFVVVHMVIGNFIEPKVTGKGLSLSTLVVFLSLVFWGWILGPIGMILSVPLTSLAKIALESYEGTQGFGIMLGTDAKD